jgi:hypothetical protein
MVGGAEGIRTPDPLREKPSLDLDVTSANVLASFINDKKDVKGLTNTGEELLRGTIGRFPRWLPVALPQANREHIIRYLGFFDTVPWRKHACYRLRLL